MTIEASLKVCEEAVRRADPDRYLSALFAPAERRPLLFALYAFNHELARIGEVVREPMMGAIRLEWWREVVAEARDGHPRAHDVARGLAELFARSGPSIEPFEAMIDAREFDVSTEIFPDMRSLVHYADATSGSVMRIASAVLLDEGDIDEAAHEAGTAYGLAGILRAIPFPVARQKLFVPADILKAEGVAPEDVLSGKADRPKLGSVIAKVAEHAKAHYESARKRPLPDHALPAFLPATLVPQYLKRLTRRGYDPLRGLSDVPAYRKQISFLRAAFTRRL